jgi:hypothetical protein
MGIMIDLPHEYGPSNVGHGEAQCIWCYGTNRENAVIEPDKCSKRMESVANGATALLDPIRAMLPEAGPEKVQEVAEFVSSMMSISVETAGLSVKLMEAVREGYLA